MDSAGLNIKKKSNLLSLNEAIQRMTENGMFLHDVEADAPDEELKSCPHCGGMAKLKDWVCGYESGTSIVCESCGASMHDGVEDGDGFHNRAIKKWNKRV